MIQSRVGKQNFVEVLFHLGFHSTAWSSLSPSQYSHEDGSYAYVGVHEVPGKGLVLRGRCYFPDKSETTETDDPSVLKTLIEEYRRAQ